MAEPRTTERKDKSEQPAEKERARKADKSPDDFTAEETEAAREGQDGRGHDRSRR